MVPLLTLADSLSDTQGAIFLLGVRSRETLPLTETEIQQRGIQVASEDGGMGFHGLVTDLFKSIIERKSRRPIKVYACGPEAMTTAVKAICIERVIPAEVSLEVPMGCGIGVCQSCAVPKEDGSGYLLVCQDGPVFDIRAVDLEGGRAK